ncbi:unnamed protein product, partial [Scytosiphon promiscuus]
MEENGEKIIVEGRAVLSVTPGVFYSEHQVLQRDLSVAVLRAFRSSTLDGGLRLRPQRRQQHGSAGNSGNRYSGSGSESTERSADNGSGAVQAEGGGGDNGRTVGRITGERGLREEAKHDPGRGPRRQSVAPALGARLLRVCDVLAGGGVRAIRYALEAGPVEVLANDQSAE